MTLESSLSCLACSRQKTRPLPVSMSSMFYTQVFCTKLYQKLQSWNVTWESCTIHFCTKKASVKCWWIWHPVSMSPTFYEHLMGAKIPKLLKDTHDFTVFCSLMICARKYIDEINPMPPNILLAAFLYQSVFHTFSLLSVCICYLLSKEFQHKSCSKNVAEIDSLSLYRVEVIDYQ